MKNAFHKKQLIKDIEIVCKENLVNRLIYNMFIFQACNMKTQRTCDSQCLSNYNLCFGKTFCFRFKPERYNSNSNCTRKKDKQL